MRETQLADKNSRPEKEFSMEKDMTMPDLEQVVYEMIRFFMKWGLWKSVFICCEGKFIPMPRFLLPVST